MPSPPSTPLPPSPPSSPPPPPNSPASTEPPADDTFTICPECGEDHGLPNREGFLFEGLMPVTDTTAECLICRDDAADPVRLPCHPSHIFCRNCIAGEYGWLSQPHVHRCPACRTQLFSFYGPGEDVDPERTDFPEGFYGTATAIGGDDDGGVDDDELEIDHEDIRYDTDRQLLELFSGIKDMSASIFMNIHMQIDFYRSARELFSTHVLDRRYRLEFEYLLRNVQAELSARRRSTRGPYPYHTAQRVENGDGAIVPLANRRPTLRGQRRASLPARLFN